MSEYHEIFSGVVQSLISGEVICEARTSDFFQFLSNPIHETEVRDYIRRIDRTLRQTSDSLAWFAAYTEIDSNESRNAVKLQFSEVINDLEPLVRWINMVSSIVGNGSTFQTGDILKRSDMHKSIEAAPAHCEELARMSTRGLFKNAQSSAQGQLEAILSRLVERQYLVASGRSKTQYIATGKWSRLYDLMAFIQSHEQIDSEEEEQAGQRSLEV